MVKKLSRIEKAANEVLDNGRRLLNDADSLSYEKPPATAHYLALIAQEEFAKAFILSLVHRNVIPWDEHIRRATMDHKCKQLVCIVLDYLTPDIDEFIEICNALVLRNEKMKFPKKVADAINILRYEKIGRWRSNSWVWGEDPVYDRETLSIAEGKWDRQKQDALYVRLNRSGGVATIPTRMNYDSVSLEIERGNRFAAFVDQLLKENQVSAFGYKTVEEVFRLLFTESASAGA